MNAATVIATIDAYNKASLSGDVTESMSVDFTNSSGSKGKVGQGQTATLKLSGWPHTTIQSITLYMRSNKSSGSAAVTLSLDGFSWLAAEGEFASWPGVGAYSTENIPVQCISQSCDVEQNATLLVQVTGSVNSVYLQRMEVTYSEPFPEPARLTLVSLNAQGEAQREQLIETTIGEGFVLPAIEEREWDDGNEIWHFVGWCPESVDAQQTTPVYYEEGCRYNCSGQCLLYALYTNAVPAETIYQDTSCLSGEYAMVIKLDTTAFVLEGTWEDNRILANQRGGFTSTSNGLTWSVNGVEETMRYQLSFYEDSLTIQHVASQSWIGHTKQSASKNKTKWAWRRMGQGTILIYSTITQTQTMLHAQCLSTHYDLLTKQFYVCYSNDELLPDYTYWYLFPVSQVPLPVYTCYTTFPELTPLVSVIANQPACVKTLDQQGRIKISNQHHSFTILGQPL